MKILAEPIQGLKILQCDPKRDSRGYFVELFKQSDLRKNGIHNSFIQMNQSVSIGYVRRGLHFQWNPPMAKLMRVSRGLARLVAVDLRRDSRTLGESFATDVSEDDFTWVYAEYGFARGFQTSSEFTEIQYLVSGEYNRDGEGGISSRSPGFESLWQSEEVLLSEKDQNLPTFQNWILQPESHLLLKEDC